MRGGGIIPSDVTGVRPPTRGRGIIDVVMFAGTPKRCLVLTASPGYRLNGRTLGCDEPRLPSEAPANFTFDHFGRTPTYVFCTTLQNK